MTRLIFVTGGARSGKSRFAEELAGQDGQGVTYLATAVPFDHEMRERIGRHQLDRPAHWQTVEEPLNLIRAVQEAGTPTLLLDCLGVWVNNLLFHEATDEQVLQMTQDTLQVMRQSGRTVIVVTNEVGLGIVPDNALSRRYRDLLGWVNQRFAAESDEAWLLVSGLSLRLKGEP